MVSLLYRRVVRALLFMINPEVVHDIMMVLLRLSFFTKFIRWLYGPDVKGISLEVCGLKFPNYVGLAAGFDKNAECIEAWSDLGFGFVEIGTVTPLPQPGNPKPRLFRLRKDKALINRMGFNNDGVVDIRERLKKRNPEILVGGNIGKNKITPNEDALNDYLTCFAELYDVVDYFVVNVSSPNTPDLRKLQEKEPLRNLLSSLMNENRSKPVVKPIFLKIAPDLSNQQIDDIIGIVQQTGISGIIATNTTVARDNLKTPYEIVDNTGDGGLSGLPLSKRSTEVIQYIHTKSEGKIPIIGVGGIHSAKEAIDKIKAGASLVQVYTGFVYEGPGLIKEINQALAEYRHGENKD